MFHKFGPCPSFNLLKVYVIFDLSSASKSVTNNISLISYKSNSTLLRNKPQLSFEPLFISLAQMVAQYLFILKINENKVPIHWFVDADNNGQPQAELLMAMMVCLCNLYSELHQLNLVYFQYFQWGGKWDNESLQTDLHGMQSWGHGAVMWFYCSIL